MQLSFDDQLDLIFDSKQGNQLETLIEPLRQNAKADIEPVIKFQGIDISVLNEPILFVTEADRKNSVFDGIVALTPTRFAFLQRKLNQTTVERAYKRSDISEVKWFPRRRELTFVCGSALDAYVSRDRKLRRIANQLIQDMESNEALADVILTARGANGSVQLFEDRVVIIKVGLDYKSLLPEDLGVSDFVNPAKVFSLTGTRKALGNFNRDVGPEVRQNEIALKDITHVGWKAPGTTDGHIQFGYVGAHAPFNLISRRNNAVVFKSKQLAVFENLKMLVEEKRAQINRPASGETTVPSPMDELKKLAELKEMGIVTEDEFEQKKKQLLGI